MNKAGVKVAWTVASWVFIQPIMLSLSKDAVSLEGKPRLNYSIMLHIARDFKETLPLLVRHSELFSYKQLVRTHQRTFRFRITSSANTCTKFCRQGKMFYYLLCSLAVMILICHTICFLIIILIWYSKWCLDSKKELCIVHSMYIYCSLFYSLDACTAFFLFFCIEYSVLFLCEYLHV